MRLNSVVSKAIDSIAAKKIRERVTTLLNWHGDNPVSEYERHRNQAIFEKQGNRNPLIDHPDWAGKIRFALGLARV